MWNTRKSIILSCICTKVVIIIGIVLSIAMPVISENMLSNFGHKELNTFLLTISYSAAMPMFASVLCLDKLLYNIKKDNVFIDGNVKLLRGISWCAFLFSAIALVGGSKFETFVFISIASAFMGLILRVIKNVFEKAIEIKTENDYTV